MQTLRRNGKTVTKFVTPSGVVAVIAPQISEELLTAMRRKLERKLLRSGHLKQKDGAPD